MEQNPLITAIAIGALELLMVPIVLFIVKRFIGTKLDDFDKKREDARYKTEIHDEAMEKGMRSLLRAELIHEHRKWMAKGFCPLESKEYAQHTYEAYHCLGGNDIGTSMYDDIMHLPTGTA